MADDPSLLLTAVDQVPFILAVCEGPELRVLSLSAATRSVIPGREFRGRPIREVLSDLVGQQFVDAYHEVYRTGEPINGREWRVHLSAPDGSVHEMYANFSITPWTVDGERRGVIGVGFDVTEMVRQRQAAAEQTADLRLRYDQSRTVITALQRELLPPGLPVLPGAQIAASYLLAEADTAAGGDWFDAVAQRDGRVALIVGDVVGHGVTASGVMGQLRAVLQDRLEDGAGIVEALAAADRFATRVPAAHATTVALVALDPVSGEIAYCTAGHPAPLVVNTTGGTRYLPATGGAPLGTGGAFPVRRERLDPGELLLLYSDGILERPGRDHTTSAAELAQVAADSAAGRALHDPVATPAERVCTQSVELLVRTTGHTDDITLLAVQRIPVEPDLDLELSASPDELRASRQAVGAWLGRLGATGEDVFALQHALGELLANAIEHAGTTLDATITLRATLTPAGVLTATVTDHGTWQSPRPRANRGRGLALAAQLVASLKVDHSESGTVAHISKPLSRPARLLDVPRPADDAPVVPLPSPAGPEPGFKIVELHDGDETRIRIEGPIDMTTATLARQELLRRSRGGTVPLTVDLSLVTHLSSAGVSALHHVAGQHDAQNAPLVLDAAPGSPAQVILALVSLLSSD
ncbi:SpoIIE family protein phosphatase [Actinoplanes sp. LDG1-06]|uniref:SpoIIE family protein phosphatase n=1 Tax=Paractinoplanes ovalisporus TaxID=2810368 RepID=A0ABS2AJI5_9ACTN|nr:SpoIIE family protein phosphatase [Actinoplanes ovalisporus]MBM2620007.1 SpoIIE family protein phosphatase [Actinoplanes ovalisporus]